MARKVFPSKKKGPRFLPCSEHRIRMMNFRYKPAKFIIMSQKRGTISPSYDETWKKLFGKLRQIQQKKEKCGLVVSTFYEETATLTWFKWTKARREEVSKTDVQIACFVPPSAWPDNPITSIPCTCGMHSFRRIFSDPGQTNLRDVNTGKILSSQETTAGAIFDGNAPVHAQIRHSHGAGFFIILPCMQSKRGHFKKNYTAFLPKKTKQLWMRSAKNRLCELSRDQSRHRKDNPSTTLTRWENDEKSIFFVHLHKTPKVAWKR